MVEKIKKSNATDVEVLSDFAARSGVSDVGDLVMICRTCKETGADFPEALRKGADVIGDKIALEREIRTIMSQKRFEGRIIASSPFFITALVKLVSAEYLAPLTQTQPGRVISTAALALMAAGAFSVERVNRLEI